MKRVLHLSLFVCVFLVLFCFANVLFLPARTQEIAVDSYHWEHTGLQLLEPNTVDVIYLGSSHVFCSISPEDIFKESGITGYVLSSSCQKVWQSYFNLLEALETQSPKVVMLDAFMVLDGGVQSEAFNREAIENMKWSKAKKEAIDMAVDMNPEEEFELGYYFPVFRYHDRWSELEEKDFKYFVTPNHAATKGFLPRIGTVQAIFNEESYVTSNVSEINSLCREYLDKIKNLCKENDCELILTKMPTCLWSGDWAATVQSYATENDLVYLDYNADEELRSEVSIDWSLDSLDGGNHLNYDGAMKMTAVWGKYLTEHFQIEDKRNNPDYAFWNEDYKYYKQCVNNYKLAQTNELSEWLKYMNNEYSIVFCNLGMDESLLSEIDKNAIQEWDILQYKYGISVYEDLQKIVSQEQSTDSSVQYVMFDKNLTLDFQENDGIVSVTSGYNHETFKMSQQGIMGIVFDKVTGKKVDIAAFAVNSEGILVRQP